MEKVSEEVYAACGVPVALFRSGQEGTGQRESFRRFLRAPVGG
ncbi:MAG: hypothetical protein OXG58_11515 [Gemmatimonadetes bacterium]|nr:hypothetical protein [Gemmatimonadota bacterium]MCY3943476.1 hypothetical protein [Gemmatimonadota bacterium]